MILPSARARSRVPAGPSPTLSLPLAQMLMMPRREPYGAAASSPREVDRSRDVGAELVPDQRCLHSLGGPGLAWLRRGGRLTEKLGRALGVAGRLDHHPGHDDAQVASGRPGEHGKADPAVGAGPDDLEKLGIEHRPGHPLELQMGTLAVD
jgi:hypothetical protein